MMPTVSLRIIVAEDERWLGGAIYIENVVAALSVLPEADRPRVLLEVHSHPNSELVRRLSSYPTVAIVPPEPNVFARIADYVPRLAERVPIPRPIKAVLVRGNLWLANRMPVDDIVFPVWGYQPRLRRPLYWIPDFQHHYLPHLFSQKELDSRNKTFVGMARAKGFMILSSHAAAADFRRFYPDARITTRVWSFCSNITGMTCPDVAEVRARYGVPEKFLYVPNQFWVHKDHITLFRALKLLKAKGLAPSVVCTGFQSDYRQPNHFSDLQNFLVEAGLSEQVHFLGVVPRTDQYAIFRAAAAIVQPSLFEGWSTVIEDTKAIGRPLIASDIPVHKEQVGESGLFFPRSSVEDLAEILAGLWPTLRPGPDPAAEASARAATDARRIAGARQFAAILAEVAAFGGRPALLAKAAQPARLAAQQD